MGIHEDTQNNLVTATVELAGLTKENSLVDADVIIHQLTISGKHNTSGQTEDKEKRVTVRERWHGKFSRSLPLPRGCYINSYSARSAWSLTCYQPEELRASLEDGVLTVTFPKTTPEQAPIKKRTKAEVESTFYMVSSSGCLRTAPCQLVDNSWIVPVIWHSARLLNICLNRPVFLPTHRPNATDSIHVQRDVIMNYSNLCSSALGVRKLS
jgi:HSP20 family molecular chaperone IbpA